MRLPVLSPWIWIPGSILAVVVLGAFSGSFLRSGIWDASKELEVLSRVPSKGPGDPPVFAYLISGTGGDGPRILRLLKAVYHPRNRYLLQLDAGSAASERRELALSVHSERVFRYFGNVDVVGNAYAVDRAGPSAVAATLHGASILLKVSTKWDWFITLSASDYPIVTQDDFLCAFTSLPRDLNFIDHTSDLGWKEFDRFDKIVVDPSLYMDRNTQFFHVTETRKTPDAFKIFTGSPWVILSRPFAEYCVNGLDNFPRKLLMYFANVAYAIEAYFQTVICNSPEFRNTTVNNDLRFFAWDDPPKLEPLFLNQSDYPRMTDSGAAFARQFLEGDLVLQKVDEDILQRSPNGVGVGSWCSENPGNYRGKHLEADQCSRWGDINTLRPGPSGRRLRSLISELISDKRLHSDQCKLK